jgi:MFS family permease
MSRAPAAPAETIAPETQPERLRDLTAAQWKSGLAAWLGWMFDGLDMHLYTLVALPFVASLLATDTKDPRVGTYSAYIQAAFLFGWALGGGFFGRIGDRLGRSRALVLTILTYAIFTGLSFFAQAWWHLLIFRFLAALGIGGEWAVGAALLSETWPKRWRPWLAAVLQSGVNIGVVMATIAAFTLSGFPHRTVFLVGILPALITLWIRRAVPETEAWHAAKEAEGHEVPGVLELFRGEVRNISILTIAVCALSLTAHWAFTFWSVQQLRSLPEVAALSEADQSKIASQGLAIVMFSSIAGNFLAALLARAIGYRWAIVFLCVTYGASMVYTYHTPRDYHQVMWLLPLMGASSGMFALFTMYLPPLFPTLLRTTGAGFCYNIGRIAAAFGTLFFGLYSRVSDFRTALFFTGFFFIPAAVVSAFLPEPKDEVVPQPTPELAPTD